MPWNTALVGTPAALAPQTSAANAAQARTVPALAGAYVWLKKIILFASAAANATVTVSDGGDQMLNLGTIALTTAPTILDVNFAARKGSSAVVNVGAAGAGITTTLSVVAEYVP